MLCVRRGVKQHRGFLKIFFVGTGHPERELVGVKEGGVSEVNNEHQLHHKEKNRTRYRVGTGTAHKARRKKKDFTQQNPQR